MDVKLFMLVIRAEDEGSMYTLCNRNQALEKSLNQNYGEQ
jgi:hypothetical protein